MTAHSRWSGAIIALGSGRNTTVVTARLGVFFFAPIIHKRIIRLSNGIRNEKIFMKYYHNIPTGIIF